MSTPGIAPGEQAPDFTLNDENGQPVNLYTRLQSSAILLIFYPGDFHRTCTKQLCNYRDNLQTFKEYGVQLIGISGNSPKSHELFTQAFEFPFPLLSDPEQKLARQYGCTSLWMLGGLSRGLFIIHPKGKILYRFIEPTVMTRRSAAELTGVLKDLRKHGLL